MPSVATLRAATSSQMTLDFEPSLPDRFASPPQKLPAMIVQAREVAKAKAAARLPSAGPKQRKKRTSFVILNARPNKWGFAKLEPLEVISGKYQGQRGQYVGAANSRDAYVRIDGVDRAIRTEQLRRVAG